MTPTQIIVCTLLTIGTIAVTYLVWWTVRGERRTITNHTCPCHQLGPAAHAAWQQAGGRGRTKAEVALLEPYADENNQ